MVCKSKYPQVRLGEWEYDSVNYICLTPDGTPQKYIVKRTFRITSQKDGFVFAIDPEGVIDGFGAWKEDGTNCYKEINLVQDRIGVTGNLNMFIKERDKCKRVIRFVGNFVQGGFIPQSNTVPLVGIVNAYWVKDL